MVEKERFGKLPDIDQPKPRARTCENCSHFAVAEVGKLPPTCRAKPPQMVGIPDPRSGQLGFIGMWPPTEKDRWCSEHLLDPSHY